MTSRLELELLERVARQRDWHRLLAKSHPAQTLLAHAKSVMGIALALMETLGVPTEDSDTLMLSAFLHDMGKESAEFQEAIMAQSKAPPHLPTRDQILEFLRACGIDDEDITARVFAIASSTHDGVGEAVSALRGLGGERKGAEPINQIYSTITVLADHIASASSPQDAFRATQEGKMRGLVKSSGAVFAYYSLLKVRGVLTYVLHKALQQAYHKCGFHLIAVFPDGALFAGREALDEEKLKREAVKAARRMLETALLDRAFLESATAMQINRGMIGNEGIVALNSLDTLVDYAMKTTLGLPGKTDDQKRAIFLRFISTLQNSLRSKIEALQIDASEKETTLGELARLEVKTMGIDFGQLGLPTTYDGWNEELAHASKALQRTTSTSRDIMTMPLEKAFETIKKAYLKLVQEMRGLFAEEKFSPLVSMETESYLVTLLSDVAHPRLTANDTNGSDDYGTVQMVADRYQRVYYETKPKAMGPVDGELRCPICGSAARGTKSISAAVGKGTKKFMNIGVGTERLDNVNICELCVLEGILRGAIGYGYVLLPQVSLSAAEAEDLAKKAAYLRRLDRSPEKSVKLFVEGRIDDFTESVNERLERLCSTDREPFKISKNVVGNYVLMTTSPDPVGLSNSEGLAMILLKAIVLSIILDLRVRVVEGLDMVDISEREGAVVFPANGSLLRTLGLRDSIIPFDRREEIGRRLALAMRAKFFADLSKRNGIQEALTTHPGQLAQRILVKRDSAWLSDKEIMVLTGLLEVGEMEDLVEAISDILEKYYRPEKYGSSMHSILGPMNALYNEFRQRTDLDKETIHAIAGRVHRQLQQLNKGDYLFVEAAEPILQVCETLAERLAKVGPRARKKILDDLRYAVYLKRLTVINERMRAKRGEKK